MYTDNSLSAPQSKIKFLTIFEVGLFEIVFVSISLLLLFGVLNYFNIVSLNSFPFLGFLPHQTAKDIKHYTSQITQQNKKSPLYGQTVIGVVTKIQDNTYTIYEKNRQIIYSFIVDSRTQYMPTMYVINKNAIPFITQAVTYKTINIGDTVEVYIHFTPVTTPVAIKIWVLNKATYTK